MASMDLTSTNTEFVLRLYVDINNQELRNIYNEAVEKHNATLYNPYKDSGFDIGNTQSCVTPVYLKGSIPEAMALVQDLRENYGIFCSIVVYPVIPKGMILLRLIPTATHTLEDVQITLKAFSGIREKLENGTYKRLSEGVMASS